MALKINNSNDIIIGFTCALVAMLITSWGYSIGVQSKTQSFKPENDEPILIDKALFYCQDSIIIYGDKAFYENDPKGLFVTGMAAQLKADDPDYPDYLPTVDRAEGEELILEAANLGYPEAIQYIYCRHKFGLWRLPLPETK